MLPILALVSSLIAEVPAVELHAPIKDKERTQVLVLGTEHLATLGERFTPGLLCSLLDALAEFGPGVIAVEALPPAEVDRLANAADSSEASAQILAAFAGDALRYGREAQAALGLTYEGAAAAADAMLRGGAPREDEARRSLCLHLLAAYDLPSAVLQWSPGHQRADVAAQWHLFCRTRLESGLDRARAALWEARNLNIASRIRQASAFHAGGRILVVIGAAHKPFLDQYLGLMMDVEILQPAGVVERPGRVPEGDLQDAHGAAPVR